MESSRDLLAMVHDPQNNVDRIATALDILAASAVDKINSVFAPRRLAKADRAREPLPTDPRQLSSYRTRLGTMLEYAISTEIDVILRQTYNDQLSLTFAVAHEYPDFYVRDRDLHPVLRLEMKSVDAASEEQAARFETPTINIDSHRDYVLFVAWEWRQHEQAESPEIFAHVVVPCFEIARERDKRLEIVGGRIEGEKVLVPSTKKPGEFVMDPGNYGKLWRIVHPTRRNSSSLSPHAKRFVDFLKAVDERAARSRFEDSEQDAKLSDFSE